MKKFLSSISMAALAFCFTTSLAYGMHDDFDHHATFVRGTCYNHTATVIGDIPEGAFVLYDDSLPDGQQLCLRPKGKWVQYTCPPVANVPGLEKSRDMGVCPEFTADHNGTWISVLSASIEGQDFPPLPGIYHRSGCLEPLSSVLENDNWVNTWRIKCRTGQRDSTVVFFDFKETYHAIVNFWDLNQSFDNNYCQTLINNQPNGTDLPRCFTFSCWYKSTGETLTLEPKNLFELSYAATEPHLAGHTKKLSLCMSNVTDQAQLYVGLYGSKLVEEIKPIQTGTQQVCIAEAVPKTFETVWEETGEYKEKEVHVELGKPHQKLCRKGELPGYKLIGGTKYGSFVRIDKVPIMRQVKKVIAAEKPAVYEDQPIYEDKTFYTLPVSALNDGHVDKEGWMNFVMHVNADTKEAKVFCNGTLILSSPTVFDYSLNSPFTWKIGEKHAAQLAEVHLIQGQLVPAPSFCVRNSENKYVSVKFQRLHSTGNPGSHTKEPDGKITVVTDNNTNASYQLESDRFAVEEDGIIKIPYSITVQPDGKMSLGLLNSARNGWYGGELILEAGTYEGIYERMVPPGETETSLVFRNYHLGTPGQTTFTIEKIDRQLEIVNKQMVTSWYARINP